MHFYDFPRTSTITTSILSMTHTKLTLLERSFNYINILILLCLPFNTALARTIFSDDFERLGGIDGVEGGGYWTALNDKITITTDNPRTGDYSMRFRFPERNSKGYSNAQKNLFLGGYYPEFWCKYDLYVPANYAHELNPTGAFPNNKAFLAAWAGTYDGANREGPLIWTEFTRVDSSENVSSIGFKLGSRINGVIQYGGKYKVGKTYDRNAITSNDKGHWMTIVIHAKYATKADWIARTGGDPNADYPIGDGVYELWKTDWQGVTTKLIDVQTGAFYATKPNSFDEARGFNQGYLLGWANGGYPEETVFNIDNIVFSTTPLTFDRTAAPRPPKLLNGLQ